MDKKTKFRDPDFSMMCACAMRYAIGRHTYVVGDVCDYIREKMDDICTGYLQIMIRDIKEARFLGDYCDEQEWNRLRADMERKVEKRKENGEE